MSGAGEAEQVNYALGVLESAKIENLTIDVAHKRISIQASSLWNKSSGVQQNTVTFEGVASFYVVRGAKEKRFEPPGADRFPNDTLVGECDGAGYYPAGIGQVQIHAPPGSWESKWVGDFNTRPNFLITINGSVLLLEARLVLVDDTAFEVGYVHDVSSSEEQ